MNQECRIDTITGREGERVSSARDVSGKRAVFNQLFDTSGETRGEVCLIKTDSIKFTTSHFGEWLVLVSEKLTASVNWRKHLELFVRVFLSSQT